MQRYMADRDRPLASNTSGYAADNNKLDYNKHERVSVEVNDMDKSRDGSSAKK